VKLRQDIEELKYDILFLRQENEAVRGLNEVATNNEIEAKLEVERLKQQIERMR
jgi:hypothetical protein